MSTTYRITLVKANREVLTNLPVILHGLPSAEFIGDKVKFNPIQMSLLKPIQNEILSNMASEGFITIFLNSVADGIDEEQWTMTDCFIDYLPAGEGYSLPRMIILPTHSTYINLYLEQIV